MFFGTKRKFSIFDKNGFIFFKKQEGCAGFPLLNSYCKTTHLGGFLGPNKKLQIFDKNGFIFFFSPKTKKVVPDFHC